MKIKVKQGNYEKVMAGAKGIKVIPSRQWWILKRLVEILSRKELKETDFSYTTEGMDNLKFREPCLILMNHSSFIDLKIAFTIFKHMRFSIVCTSDGFVGKSFLMRKLGCIPTQKFVPDVPLVKNMIFASKVLHQSILMYPEASYSFDGTATSLPTTLGRFIQVLNIPVVMVKTEGAFHRDPLYNNLQIRKVPVKAHVKYLFSPDDLAKLLPDEINEKLKNEFTFDNFRWQQINEIKVSEPFRADYLNRVLYKCPACFTEGKMEGKGIHIKCNNCSKSWELTENGFIKALEGQTEYQHIPEWFNWQRASVRKEIENEEYNLDIDVKILVMTNTRCIYDIGQGHLIHNKNGFYLNGDDGKLQYHQKPLASYSLYSDYYWYELGDMICIGNMKMLYYCFPLNTGDIVAKTRLATEEIYKIAKISQLEDKMAALKS